MAGFIFENDIEVVVEGGDLIHFRKREPHFMRQGDQMPMRQMALIVLNEVEMFNQEIAAAGTIAKQNAHVVKRVGVDLAALFKELATLATPGLVVSLEVSIRS